MIHKLIIVTKDSNRLATIAMNVLQGENFVDVAKLAASDWLQKNSKSSAISHVGNGNFTVWVN